MKSFFPESPLVPLGLLVVLSGWCLWRRYRLGRLLSPVGGLHAQILLCFGVSGIAAVLFPNEHAFLQPDSVRRLIPLVVWPLAFGYAGVVVLEFKVFRMPRRMETALRDDARFSAGTLILLAMLSFFGQAFVGYFGRGGVRLLPSYLAAFFFPSLLLAMIGIFSHRKDNPVLVAGLVLFAGWLAVFSPWRSILIMLTMVMGFGLVLARPRFLWPVVCASYLLMSFMLPFLAFKKQYYEAFCEHPLQAVAYTLSVPPQERIELPLRFFAERLSYVKELVYVYNGLESGLLELTHGDTYRLTLQQLVPRVLWPGKPELAFKAGHNLPRQVGLLQEEDPYTSAAVNLYAEATYNFGIWHLLWFVPFAFYMAELLGRFVAFWFTSPKAQVLLDTSFFFGMVNVTSLIFLASTIVAMLVLGKAMELTFLGVKAVWRWPRRRKRRQGASVMMADKQLMRAGIGCFRVHRLRNSLVSSPITGRRYKLKCAFRASSTNPRRVRWPSRP